MVEIVIISYNIAGLLVGAYIARNWRIFLKDCFVEHLKYQCYAVYRFFMSDYLCLPTNRR